MKIGELKSAYRISAAWRDLGLAGEPGKVCRSPFPSEHKHGDINPSFGVFDDDTRWKNFTTGEHGDVFDLIAKARGETVGGAIRFVKERLGIADSERQTNAAQKTRSRIPPLREGTDSELRELANRRGFTVDALRLAQRRGFLFLTTLWGNTAWCITDSRRTLFEFRRLDGRKWPPYGRLPERKCHCIGTGKNWPIGALESGPFVKVAWVEGSPDFIALFDFLLIEGKVESVAPVTVLGASNHVLSPEALSRFKGKQVCLYPHADEAGRRAAYEWALQLHEAGVARVRAFDLSGLVLVDGGAGKDLADACRISADCFEQERKFWEVLP